jgi:hypothetical protein
MPPLKVPAVVEPVRIGQVRSDKLGATVQVVGLSPAQRYVCRYPQLDDEVAVLGGSTIMKCYPIVVSG